jgi:hypothetical protein
LRSTLTTLLEAMSRADRPSDHFQAVSDSMPVAVAPAFTEESLPNEVVVFSPEATVTEVAFEVLDVEVIFRVVVDKVEVLGTLVVEVDLVVTLGWVVVPGSLVDLMVVLDVSG